VRTDSTQQFKKLINQRQLAGEDLSPGHLRREPPGAINLGEFLHLPRTGRPFALKAVASQTSRIEISFDGPGRNDLSARLLDRFEREVFADRGITSSLFPELASGRCQRVLIIDKLTLRNCPRAIIFLRQNGPPG
jgi:hypothetical protein